MIAKQLILIIVEKHSNHLSFSDKVPQVQGCLEEGPGPGTTTTFHVNFATALLWPHRNKLFGGFLHRLISGHVPHHPRLVQVQEEDHHHPG